MSTRDYAGYAKVLLEIQAKCREWGQALRKNGWDDAHASTHAQAVQTEDARVAELVVMGLIKRHEPVLTYCRTSFIAEPSTSLDRAFDYIGKYINSGAGKPRGVPEYRAEHLAIEVLQPSISEQYREPTFIVQLGRWAQKLGEKAAEGNGGRDPDIELGRRPEQSEPDKRSWTQSALDKAIHMYKAERAPRYSELRDAVEKDKKGAKKDAQALFGRNVIVKALGVRSPSMVSKSPAWVAIAEDLRIQLKRNRTTGTKHTVKAGKIGEEIALEQAAQATAKGDVPEMDGKEREETLSQIRSLAASGAKDAKSQAELLFDAYNNGEMTDKDVRGTVKTLLEQG